MTPDNLSGAGLGGSKQALGKLSGAGYNELIIYSSKYAPGKLSGAGYNELRYFSLSLGFI